jgi:hypothetical protein
MKKFFARCLGVSFTFVLAHAALSQGSLTPPGVPAPTMRSLEQIEPRIPISTVHTPGDNYSQFIITQPGSYYLTTNIVGATDKDCIRIWASDVTLDLNGFSLLGTSNASYGLFIFSGIEDVTVRNGIITGWKKNDISGLASFGHNVTFENLTVSSNDTGIWCAGTSTIRDCIVNGNQKHGINATANDCSILNNRSFGNNPGVTASYAGIRVDGANNRVEGNHVTCSGLGAPGIHILNSGGYTNNVVVRNVVMRGGFNNYSINTVVNDVGPIGGASTNNSPWLNISR